MKFQNKGLGLCTVYSFIQNPTLTFKGHIIFYKVLLATSLLLMSVHSQAQVKGVWGRLHSARPQKIGETYAGLMKGNGSPTGVTVLTHLGPRLAAHMFWGIDYKGSNVPIINQGRLYGIGFQPRINFRNKNLNGAYYTNISMVGGTDRTRYTDEKQLPTNRVISKMVNVKTEFKVGIGAFFEVYKKYQIFAEKNVTVGYKCDSDLYWGGAASHRVGIRLSMW